MTRTTDQSFENEELRRKAEEQKGKLHPPHIHNLPEGWNSDKIEDMLEWQRDKAINPIKGMNIAERDAEEPNTIQSELYEFEEFGLYSMTCIVGATKQLFCMNCLHRLPDRHGCLQGYCETLDRIDGRLWKVEG